MHNQQLLEKLLTQNQQNLELKIHNIKLKARNQALTVGLTTATLTMFASALSQLAT